MLVVGPAALAGFFTGTWRGPGVDEKRLKGVRFQVSQNDVVKGFYIKGLMIYCQTSKGPVSYPLYARVKDQDSINDQNVFRLQAQTDSYDSNNGTLKVRGEATELGTKFRGAVRLIDGDYIVGDEDIGNCSSGGPTVWKAKLVD